MSAIEALAAAHKIAEEVGIDTADLDGLLPEQQVARIRDRIARHLLVLSDELHGLTGDKRLQRNAGHKIAA